MIFTALNILVSQTVAIVYKHEFFTNAMLIYATESSRGSSNRSSTFVLRMELHAIICSVVIDCTAFVVIFCSNLEVTNQK
jgi:hypothetical protein